MVLFLGLEFVALYYYLEHRKHKKERLALAQSDRQHTYIPLNPETKQPDPEADVPPIYMESPEQGHQTVGGGVPRKTNSQGEVEEEEEGEVVASSSRLAGPFDAPAGPPPPSSSVAGDAPPSYEEEVARSGKAGVSAQAV